MPQIDTKGRPFQPQHQVPPGWSLAAQETMKAEEGTKPFVSDPDIQRVLDQVIERQNRDQERVQNLTPGDLAFSLMRSVPQAQWHKPWTALGHFPGGMLGVSVAEIRGDKKLKNLTPGNTILELFALDDARIRREFQDPKRGAQ